MATFLVGYDPSKGKEHEMVTALHRWGATRIFRGTWVLESDSTADLARRALVGVGGIITCAIVEIKPRGVVLLRLGALTSPAPASPLPC